MSIVANLSALSSGMGLGYPAITLSALTNRADPMSLNTDQASWFGELALNIQFSTVNINFILV
jgi:hypothetical protein